MINFTELKKILLPTANISKLGLSGNLTMEKLNKNTSGLIGLWLKNPSLLIFANR